MHKYPDIEEWAWVEIMLIQAMIGLISANFRQIMLKVDSKNWTLIYTLEEYNKIDEQAIEEITSDFAGYMMGIQDKMIVTRRYGLNQEIIINGDTDINSFLPNPEDDMKERLIFRRNEHFTGWDDED